MSRHPIPYKRRKRQHIGWTIFAIVCIGLIVIIWRLVGAEKVEAAEEKPLSEETTLYPQEYFPQKTTVIPTPTNTPFVAKFTDEEIIMAAKTVWGEARGIQSEMEQAAIVWCFLNRYDREGRFGATLKEVITAPGQFYYDDSFPTVDDQGRDITNIVYDVIGRWEREKNGQTDVGRVLPSDYLWFGGNGAHNYFRNSYESFDNIWDWSLPDPYTEQ